MNYLPAQIENVDTAEGFICGLKLWLEAFDWMTSELALHYFDILDAADE